MYSTSQSGELQRRRFGQILILAFIATLVGCAIAGPRSQIVLLVAGLGFVGTFVLLARGHIRLAINAFLWVAAYEICALITINNGIYDSLMIGFALILMYAAFFASRTTFFLLLLTITLYCSVLVILKLTGYFEVRMPRLRWQSLIAINLIFMVLGLSAWFLARDFRAVLRQLIEENLRVWQSQREIERLSSLDPLTKVLSRSSLDKRSSDLFSDKAGKLIVFLDIDNFKPVNDLFGHAFGDNVLRVIADRLTPLVRSKEICCRFGGDEFVLILAEDSVEAATPRIQAIRQEILREITIELRTLKISVSLGVAVYPDHSEDIFELCRMAGLAMTRHRLSNKAELVTYLPQWDEEESRRRNMILALQEAIRTEQITVEYQPKFCLLSMRINGVEALARWHSAELGTVSPGVFIALAEETGVIDDIGRQVLRKACEDCRAWNSQGVDIPVAVNISSAQLVSGMLPMTVASILQETGLEAHHLELEITESLLVQDQSAIDSQIVQLMELGVRFSIDDFGTGYSNLHYLSRFGAATLKIDQSFVRSIHSSDRNYNLVKSIIGLAKNLGLSTVAEGVEEQHTLDVLKGLECDTVQGYLLGRPQVLSKLLQQMAVSRAP